MGLTVLSIATFTHNFLMQKFGYFNYCLNILWSLSVEEIFYMAFPLICILVRRDRIVLAVCGFFIGLGPAFRHLHLGDEIITLYADLSCFDAIALGCVAAVLSRKVTINEVASKWMMGIASAIMVGVYLWSNILDNVVWGISILAFSTAFLLFAEGSRKNKSIGLAPMGLRPILWFGKNSYELYLFHIILLALARTFFKRDELSYLGKPFLFLGFIMGSVLSAEVIGRFYAEPLNLKLKNWINPKKETV